ncbi:MAG: hypothetical protein CMJ31_03595 [Phycisphaerae bacterium]|nr:hypothetical protein [Phycisphaerae bacterium]|tara:strand:+ start:134 stop:607 length:474 start_codon:yes stop_codon:yes gene_type:complete
MTDERQNEPLAQGTEQFEAPPPAGSESYRQANHGLALALDEERGDDRAGEPRPTGRRFDAEVEIAEIDGRGRPGSIWCARGLSLSRRNLVVASRRMCYPARTLLIAVHLIDSQPFPLYGKVHTCEYDGDGIHTIDIDLLETPDGPMIRAWIASRQRQ